MAVLSSGVGPVGGTEPATSWNAVLAICAVMIAVFQGALVMESSYTMLITYKNFRIMIVLEILEVFIVILS